MSIWLKRASLTLAAMLIALGVGANSYYDHSSGVPATGSQASSATMRAEFDAIATGFDKFPPLTGNGSETLVINSAATAIESKTAAEFRTYLSGTWTCEIAGCNPLGTLESTEVGAAWGPILYLYRNSASPAASDQLGQIRFDGEDSAGNQQEYASIFGVAVDTTSTSEDGRLVLRTTVAGTETDTVTVQTGVQIGTPTGGDKGAGTLNTAGTLYQNNDPVATNGGNNTFTGTNTFSGTFTAGGATGGALPAGTVIPYAGSSEPAGFLLCYGQAVSRTTYATLFAAIGTTYGSGDGSTTFNLPDMRGRAAFGKDNMGGTSASRVTVVVSGITGTTLGSAGGSQSMQQHNHTATDAGHSHGVTDPGHVHSEGDYEVPSTSVGIGGGSVYGYFFFGAENTGSATTGISINSGSANISVENSGSGGSQNMPPAIILNYIIKY